MLFLNLLGTAWLFIDIGYSFDVFDPTLLADSNLVPEGNIEPNSLLESISNPVVADDDFCVDDDVDVTQLFNIDGTQLSDTDVTLFSDIDTADPPLFDTADPQLFATNDPQLFDIDGTQVNKLRRRQRCQAAKKPIKSGQGSGGNPDPQVPDPQLGFQKFIDEQLSVIDPLGPSELCPETAFGQSRILVCAAPTQPGTISRSGSAAVDLENIQPPIIRIIPPQCVGLIPWCCEIVIKKDRVPPLEVDPLLLEAFMKGPVLGLVYLNLLRFFLFDGKICYPQVWGELGYPFYKLK